MPSLIATLGLDTSEFHKGLASARHAVNNWLPKAAVAGMGALTAIMAAGIKNAMGLAGEMTDLSARTGLAVNDLLELKVAAEQSGTELEVLVKGVNHLQRAMLTGTDGSKELARGLDLVGLRLGDIENLDPSSQFATISAAFASIEDPAKRTAAAMAIFGRSGSEMLTILGNTDAIQQAAETLGRMPAVMERYAGAFDRVDDVVGSLPVKAQAFFTGFSAGIVGSILEPIDELNQMDFTGLGENLGDAIAPWIEATKGGALGDLVAVSLLQGIVKFTAEAFRAMSDIAGMIAAVFIAPMRYAAEQFKTFMAKAVVETADLIEDKLGVGIGLPADIRRAAMGGSSFNDVLGQTAADFTSNSNWGEALVKFLGLDAWEAEILAPFAAAAEEHKETARKLSAAVRPMAFRFDEEGMAASTASSAQNIADQFQRIGALGGGERIFARQEVIARQQLDLLKAIDLNTRKIKDLPSGPGNAVFA